MPHMLVQFLAMAVPLAGNLAAAGAALAADPNLSPATPSLAFIGAALAPQLQPLQMPRTDAMPAMADMRVVLSAQMPAPESTTVGAKADKGPLLPEELSNALGSVPFLGSVMAPVTQGLSIRTGDGTPPLTLAVMPTQITRGGGLVAIGRF